MNGSKFYVRGPTKKLIEGNTLPYFIHYTLEAERMKKGKLTIHASGVSKNGKGILILGKQGSGKTSIVLELCRKYGYSLIGNDLVLIGLQNNKGFLYGGTKIFRLRLSTVKYYNRDLKKFFKHSKDTQDEWTTITYIQPEQIHVSTEKNKAVPIKKILYVHLYNNPKPQLCVSNVDLLFSRVYLHQICSEYIRGSAIAPLIGKNLFYSCYLPSFDNLSFYRKRSKLINWIIKNKNYKYVSGPIAKICCYINEK